MFPETPAPPYYAVIFSSRLTDKAAGYEETATSMLELAARQDGFLGVESIRQGAEGISISYWRDEAAIKQWRQQADHLLAQQKGRELWYQHYQVRICKVERAAEFKAGKTE